MNSKQEIVMSNVSQAFLFHHIFLARVGVFTVMKIYVVVFWVMITCSVTVGY